MNEEFRAIVRWEIGDGRSVAFWIDMWDLGVPSLSFDQLFVFAQDRKCSVYQFYINSTERNLALPLLFGRHD